MQYELKENVLTLDEYSKLRESAGWPVLPDYQIEAGLKNSLVTISAMHENQTIGMGRLVGDGVIIFYIQDLIVYPEFQGKGIGAAIIEKLIAFAKEKALSTTQIKIGLFAAKGKEGLYRKFGFVERPNEKRGAGMELTLDKEEYHPAACISMVIT